MTKNPQAHHRHLADDDEMAPFALLEKEGSRLGVLAGITSAIRQGGSKASTRYLVAQGKGMSLRTLYPLGSGVQRVDYASVSPSLQGLGLGRKLYGAAIRRAFEDFKAGGPNRFFTSSPDGATSEAAARVWEALAKRGWPVRRSPTFPRADGADYGVDLADLGKFFKDKR